MTFNLSQFVMQAIVVHSTLFRVKYFELTCATDMVDYYKRFGFRDDHGNVVAMRLVSSPLFT